MSFCLFVCVGLNHFFVPEPVISSCNEIDVNKTEVKEVSTPTTQTKQWYHLFLIPSILVVIFNLFTTAVSIGFVAATLESHLEQV